MAIPFMAVAVPDILARIVDHKRSTLARSRSDPRGTGTARDGAVCCSGIPGRAYGGAFGDHF